MSQEWVPKPVKKPRPPTLPDTYHNNNNITTTTSSGSGSGINEPQKRKTTATTGVSPPTVKRQTLVANNSVVARRKYYSKWVEEDVDDDDDDDNDEQEGGQESFQLINLDNKLFNYEGDDNPTFTSLFPSKKLPNRVVDPLNENSSDHENPLPPRTLSPSSMFRLSSQSSQRAPQTKSTHTPTPTVAPPKKLGFVVPASNSQGFSSTPKSTPISLSQSAKKLMKLQDLLPKPSIQEKNEVTSVPSLIQQVLGDNIDDEVEDMHIQPRNLFGASPDQSPVRPDEEEENCIVGIRDDCVDNGEEIETFPEERLDDTDQYEQVDIIDETEELSEDQDKISWAEENRPKLAPSKAIIPVQQASGNSLSTWRNNISLSGIDTQTVPEDIKGPGYKRRLVRGGYADKVQKILQRQRYEKAIKTHNDPNRISQVPINVVVVHVKADSLFFALCALLDHDGQDFVKVIFPIEHKKDLVPGAVVRISPPWYQFSRTSMPLIVCTSTTEIETTNSMNIETFVRAAKSLGTTVCTLPYIHQKAPLLQLATDSEPEESQPRDLDTDVGLTAQPPYDTIANLSTYMSNISLVAYPINTAVTLQSTTNCVTTNNPATGRTFLEGKLNILKQLSLSRNRMHQNTVTLQDSRSALCKLQVPQGSTEWLQVLQQNQGKLVTFTNLRMISTISKEKDGSLAFHPLLTVAERSRTL